MACMCSKPVIIKHICLFYLALFIIYLKRSIPHNITPPPPPPLPSDWTVDTRQVGPMASCCWHQILTPPSARCSRNTDLSKSSAEFSPCSRCSLRFLFWQAWMEPDVVFCCYSSSASRFDVLCVLRCFSAHHSWWLSEVLYPFRLAILHSPLSSARRFRPQNWHRPDAFVEFLFFWPRSSKL